MRAHSSDRRVLILGASGFIGRHVLSLLEANPRLGTAIPAYRPHKGISEIVPASWVRVDPSTERSNSLEDALFRLQPDVVINCIGATSGTPEQLEEANVLVPTKIVESLSRGWRSHLIHLGSAAEYGPQPTDGPVAERAAVGPLDDYGRTKLAGSELILTAADKGMISATVLRVFNPVGAYAPESTLVGRTVRSVRLALEAGLSVITTGPLDSYRDYLDVRDVARAALMVPNPEGPVKVPPVLNIGRGEAFQSREVVRLVTSAASFAGRVVEVGEPKGHSESVNSQAADITAARESIGWRPIYRVADAVREAWQYGSGHPTRVMAPGLWR